MGRNDNSPWGERGAWVGTQVGCTAWQAIAATLAIVEGSMSALIVFMLFVGANAVGLLLWTLRHRLGLWNALMLLVLVCGTTSIGALYVLDVAGLWDAIQMEPWVYPAEKSYVAIPAVHLAVLFVLFTLSRSIRTASNIESRDTGTRMAS